MELIDKDALVAEIDKRITDAPINNIGHQRVWAYNDVKDILNNLEVKEVDLEDSIKETLAQKYVDYIFRRHDIDPESKEGMLIYYAYMHGMNQCLDKLKAQKGE
jgi:hypothetical protein